MLRLRRLMAGLVLAAGAGACAPAGAGAEVVVRDTRIREIRALDGAVLYRRAGAGPAYRRVVGGERRAASGVPEGAYPSAIGRDAAGRVVVAMSVGEVRRSRVVDRTWWLYDIARDRARPLALPRGACSPQDVSVWRGRLAYATLCDSEPSSGIFLREDGRTRRVMKDVYPRGRLHLRARFLLAVLDDGVGSPSIWRVTAGDRVCPLRLPGSYTSEEWGINEVSTRGRVLTWWVADASGHDPGGLIGLELDGCDAPGPPGPVEVADLPVPSRGRALDGRWLYTKDAEGISRRRIPKGPRTTPAPNDDVEDATLVSGEPPIVLTPTIGRATTQPGDPTERTVWFRLQPTVSQRITILGGSFGVTGPFVFEGAAIGSLTPVETERREFEAEFDVVAGRTYSFALGCQRPAADYEFACFIPYRLRIDVVTAGGASTSRPARG